jgi:hypothetical protein
VAEIAAMYTPVMKKDREEKYPAKIKAKIVLAGPPELLTKSPTFPATLVSKRDGQAQDGNS